jgi:3-methyladenine DNA glycosylase Mpg
MERLKFLCPHCRLGFEIDRRTRNTRHVIKCDGPGKQTYCLGFDCEHYKGGRVMAKGEVAVKTKINDMAEEMKAIGYDQAIQDCCKYLDTIKSYDPARCREEVKRFVRVHSDN